jgi:hypothetical protein
MRSLCHVHMRLAAGVGAWLLGVGAATAGSLLAVSLLGQGIAASTSQQLTESAVQRALAAEATDPQGADPVTTTGSPRPTPSATRSHQPRLSQGVPQIEATPSAGASRSRAASSPSAQARATATATATPTGTPTPTPTPSSTVLSSQGGTVVADCRPGGAYLLSWSPAPGYEVDAVSRGPAVTAQVIFDSAANSVTMTVSCSTGLPTATTTVGGDDGGGPGE